VNAETLFCSAVERRLCAPGSGVRVARINSGNAIITGRDGATRVFRGAKRGTGDLAGYVVGEGWHLEVECKVDGGKQTPAQRAREHALVAAGCVYVVVRLSTVDGLEQSVDRAASAVDAAIHARRHRAEA